MNIVCNNCGGADIYKLNKMEFNNPFIWCAIFADDMITLIKNWDNINFNNYKLIRFNCDSIFIIIFFYYFRIFIIIINIIW